MPQSNSPLLKFSNHSATFGRFTLVPSRYQESPGPGRASGRPHARSSQGGSQPPSSPSSNKPSWTHSDRASCSYDDNHAPTSSPARVLPFAYMTRIRPARPRPQPEDWRHSTWVTQAPRHVASHQNVRVEDLGVQELPEYALLHSADILASTSSGHRQVPRLPGINKPLAYHSGPAKYPELRPTPCWFIKQARG